MAAVASACCLGALSSSPGIDVGSFKDVGRAGEGPLPLSFILVFISSGQVPVAFCASRFIASSPRTTLVPVPSLRRDERGRPLSLAHRPPTPSPRRSVSAAAHSPGRPRDLSRTVGEGRRRGPPNWPPCLMRIDRPRGPRRPARENTAAPGGDGAEFYGAFTPPPPLSQTGRGGVLWHYLHLP